MPPRKTPTSSLSVVKLLAKRVLYRTAAKIHRKMGSGGVSAETPTTHSSPANRLPMEVVELIISYLIYDTHSLRACTSTCYTWYIAAVPHLYHTLAISINLWDGKSRWSKTIRHMHRLGLLPLVREFRFCLWSFKFSPERFSCCLLRQFSALTNVQVLMLVSLDIPKFMPRIKRYFRHFLPTVRSLTLGGPKGSRRQIIYFIGLFQHLQDLELRSIGFVSPGPPGGDPTLVPAFVPPLQGWLRLSFIRADLLKDLVELFGGIRFRYMRFYNVDGTQFLLNVCGKNLQNVVLDPADPRDLNLSRNNSLRILQIQERSPDVTLSFLERVLSTITSPTFCKITVLYGDRDFRGIEFGCSIWPRFHELSQAERAKEVWRHRRQLKVLRKAHRVRSFRLELCASICGSVGEEPLRILEEAIAEEKAQGGFNDFSSDPYVWYQPQRSSVYN